MTEFISELEVRELDGNYRQLISDFVFDSDLIGKVVVPAGTIVDYESIPLFRGSSKRAGTAHDYLYRSDSVPVVIKEVADKVYLELMKEKGISWWRRTIKYNAVKLFGGSSYHKKSVCWLHLSHFNPIH